MLVVHKLLIIMSESDEVFRSPTAKWILLILTLYIEPIKTYMH